MEGLTSFGELDKNCKDLALRGAKTVLSVLSDDKSGVVKFKPGWSKCLIECLRHSTDHLQASAACVQFAIQAVKAADGGEIFGDALDRSRDELWRKLSSCGQLFDLGTCLFETASTDVFKEHLEAWKNEKVSSLGVRST
jgi:hypothetical protein